MLFTQPETVITERHVLGSTVCWIDRVKIWNYIRRPGDRRLGMSRNRNLVVPKSEVKIWTDFYPNRNKNPKSALFFLEEKEGYCGVWAFDCWRESHLSCILHFITSVFCLIFDIVSRPCGFPGCKILRDPNLPAKTEDIRAWTIILCLKRMVLRCQLKRARKIWPLGYARKGHSKPPKRDEKYHHPPRYHSGIGCETGTRCPQHLERYKAASAQLLCWQKLDRE
jgi:hypothetical protein